MHPPLFRQCDLEGPDTLEPSVLEHLENLWLQFHLFADEHFVLNVRAGVRALLNATELGPERDQAFERIQTRYWELAVGTRLRRAGLQLVPMDMRRADGPDFLIAFGDRRLWVECVLATGGKGADRVEDWPFTNHPTVSDVPDDQAKLRLLAAIDEKRKQHHRHLASGVVEQIDLFVVAINDRCVRAALPDFMPPRVARALYGIGMPAVRFESDHRREAEWFLQAQPAVRKLSGTDISTLGFANGSLAEVSAVIYSNVDPWNPNHSWVTVHNHRASAMLPHRWLPGTTECRVHAQGSKATIEWND